MRGIKAKRLRRAIYGKKDPSAGSRRYEWEETPSGHYRIVSHIERRAYQITKRALRKGGE